MDSLTAAFKALEKTIDEADKWTDGPAARQRVTRAGRTKEREYVLLDAIQAANALLKAQRDGVGADAAIKQARRVVALARWHDAGAYGLTTFDKMC